MMNPENRNIVFAYAATVLIVAALIVLIMNVNNLFFPDAPAPVTQFTPAARGLVTQEDLRFGLFNDAKFRSLRPLLSDAERRALEASETVQPTPDQNGPITGTAVPSSGKREVRRSNPFLPFPQYAN